MAINLRELKQQKKKATLPPRILMYGPPGMGKTSLAAEFPNAIFIQTEDGTPGDREIANFPLCTSYDDVVNYIAQLAGDEHEFTTVVIDSLDKLEPLLWAKVCQDNQWNTIEDPGYGKGYITTDRYWRYLLDGLATLRNERGMTIVLIAHSTIERFDSPTSQAYNRYDIRLHKRAMAAIQDDVDAILFVNQDATIKTDKSGFNKETHRAEGGGQLWIYTVGRPAFIAKNRYGIPDKVMYREFEGYAALAKYLPGQCPELGGVDEAPVASAPTHEMAHDYSVDDDGYVPPGEPVAEPARRGGKRAA